MLQHVSYRAVDGSLSSEVLLGKGTLGLKRKSSLVPSVPWLLLRRLSYSFNSADRIHCDDVGMHFKLINSTYTQWLKR